MEFFGVNFVTLTLSVLGHMAAIVPRPFSENFTRSETHAEKNLEEVLSYFFHLHSYNWYS
jgi:hypothetical protein